MLKLVVDAINPIVVGLRVAVIKPAHCLDKRNFQDAKAIQWREHVSNAHFIKWRLGSLHTHRLMTTEKMKAMMLKEQAWEKRQQNIQALSAEAFARWLAGKEPKPSLRQHASAEVKRQHKVSREREDGEVDIAHLLAPVHNARQSMVGRKAGSCYLQMLYLKTQQETLWDPKPLPEAARKGFVFGGSEQQSTGGIPAWQNADTHALPLPK